MKSVLQCNRGLGISGLFTAIALFVNGQSIPSKEFIRLGDRVIAIENPPAASVGFGTVTPGTSLTAAAGSGSVGITSTLPTTTWNIATDAPSWFTLGSTSGTGSGTVTFNYSQNTGTTSRTTQLTLTSPALDPVTITFTQVGTSTPLTLSPGLASLNSAGQNGSFQVASTGSWTAASNSTSWLTLTPGPASGVAGTTTVTYTVTANSGSTRTGSITVTGGNDSQSFAVTQSGPSAGVNFGTVTPGTNLTVSAGSGSAAVVSTLSTTTWSVATDSPSWFHLGTSAGTGNGTATFSYDANTAIGSRNAQLTLSSPSLPSQSLTFTQAGTSSLSLTFSPASATLSSVNQGASFQVTSPGTWTAVSNSTSWLTINSGSSSGNQGTSTLAYTVAANSGTTRTGTITVTSGTSSQAFTVTQTGPGSAQTLSVSPNNIIVYWGAQQQFTAYVDGVATTTGVTWSVNNGMGTVSSTGLYTALNQTYNASVVATYGSL